MSAETDTRIFRTLILYPTPGREKEVEQRFAAIVAQSEPKFPGVLQVLLHTVIPEPGEENIPRIIVHAVYENQEASDASHAAPEFIEFFTSVMKNGDLARPVERYQCKLYAGFQRAIQI